MSTDTPDPITTKLHGTTNARVWAQEFCDQFRVAREEGDWVEDAEGLMIGWFANAIEIGRDAGTRAEQLRIKEAHEHDGEAPGG